MSGGNHPHGDCPECLNRDAEVASLKKAFEYQDKLRVALKAEVARLRAVESAAREYRFAEKFGANEPHLRAKDQYAAREALDAALAVKP